MCVCVCPFVYLPSTRHPFVLMRQIYSSPDDLTYPTDPFFLNILYLFFVFTAIFATGLTRLTPGNCFWLTTDNVSDIFPSRVNAIRACGDRTHCHDTPRSTFFMFIGHRALSTLLSLLYMRIPLSLSSRNISPAIMHM